MEHTIYILHSSADIYGIIFLFSSVLFHERKRYRLQINMLAPRANRRVWIS